MTGENSPTGVLRWASNLTGVTQCGRDQFEDGFQIICEAFVLLARRQQLLFPVVSRLLQLRKLLLEIDDAVLCALAKGTLRPSIDIALVLDLLLGQVRDGPGALLGGPRMP